MPEGWTTRLYREAMGVRPAAWRYGFPRDGVVCARIRSLVASVGAGEDAPFDKQDESRWWSLPKVDPRATASAPGDRRRDRRRARRLNYQMYVGTPPRTTSRRLVPLLCAGRTSPNLQVNLVRRGRKAQSHDIAKGVRPRSRRPRRFGRTEVRRSPGRRSSRAVAEVYGPDTPVRSRWRARSRRSCRRRGGGDVEVRRDDHPGTRSRSIRPGA